MVVLVLVLAFAGLAFFRREARKALVVRMKNVGGAPARKRHNNRIFPGVGHSVYG